MKKQYVGLIVLGLLFAGATIRFLIWHSEDAARLLGFAAVPAAALAVFAALSWRMRVGVRENAAKDIERYAALAFFALAALGGVTAIAARLIFFR